MQYARQRYTAKLHRSPGALLLLILNDQSSNKCVPSVWAMGSILASNFEHKSG